MTNCIWAYSGTRAISWTPSSVYSPLLGQLPDNGPTGTTECAQALSTVLSLCTDLDVPLAPGKVAGPALNLIFLGVELISRLLSVRICRTMPNGQGQDGT